MLTEADAEVDRLNGARSFVDNGMDCSLNEDPMARADSQPRQQS